MQYEIRGRRKAVELRAKRKYIIEFGEIPETVKVVKKINDTTYLVEVEGGLKCHKCGKPYKTKNGLKNHTKNCKG